MRVFVIAGVVSAFVAWLVINQLALRSGIPAALFLFVPPIPIYLAVLSIMLAFEALIRRGKLELGSRPARGFFVGLIIAYTFPLYFLLNMPT